MVYKFQGSFSYDFDTVNNWGNDSIGVYYVGVKTTEGNLRVFYIGRAIGDGGIRGRLLQHLDEQKWYDATHFGYRLCDTAKEAIELEVDEIAKYRPKYNTVGV